MGLLSTTAARLSADRHLVGGQREETGNPHATAGTIDYRFTPCAQAGTSKRGKAQIRSAGNGFDAAYFVYVGVTRHTYFADYSVSYQLVIAKGEFVVAVALLLVEAASVLNVG